MNSPSHDEIEQLIRQIVVPFYKLERRTPVPGTVDRYENDAEHSWSVALLACALAPQVDASLDVGLIAQFAIVHDVVEVFAGDTAVFHSDESAKASKVTREAASLKHLQSEFGYLPWISQMIEQYESQTSDEAKFVYAVDKYIAVMFDYINKVKYLKDAGWTQAQYNKQLEAHRQKAHTHAAVGKYYDEVRVLLDAHPEYFAE